MARPEGVIQYGYDAQGLLASANWLSHTVSYAYDAQGRLKEADAPEGQWRYSYGAGGQKTRGENLKTGELAHYAYDPLGHLLRVTHTGKDGKLIFKIEYARAGVLSLGPDGQRLGAYETRQNPDGSTETTRWAYGYDRLRRLVHEQCWTKINNAQETEDRNVEYTYDLAGNRLRTIDNKDLNQSEAYTYIAGSQKIQEVSYGDGTKCAFDWTANGELSKKTHKNAAGQETSREEYAWGLDGTLSEVAFTHGVNDGITVAYAYDDEGNLIERQVTDGNGKALEHKKFLVDTENLTGYSQVLAEIDVLAGGRIKYNTFTDELAAQSEAVSASQSATSYPHADGLGSVRALTGTGALGQNLSEKYDYTAFGKPLRGDRSLTNYAFTGQVADAKTGMQYHRARWLDSKSGKWISPDPVVDFPANFANEFQYVGNNPINFIDPSGENAGCVEMMTVSVSAMDIAATALLTLGFVRASLNTIGMDLSSGGTIELDWDDWVMPGLPDSERIREIFKKYIKALGRVRPIPIPQSRRKSRQPKIVYRAASWNDRQENIKEVGFKSALERNVGDCIFAALEAWKDNPIVSAWEHIEKGRRDTLGKFGWKFPKNGTDELNAKKDYSPYISVTKHKWTAVWVYSLDENFVSHEENVYTIDLSKVPLYIDLGDFTSGALQLLGFALADADSAYEWAEADSEVLCFWHIPASAVQGSLAKGVLDD